MPWSIFNEALLRLQPLLLTVDGVFAAAGAEPAAPEIVLRTRVGTSRRLKRLAGWGELLGHLRRREDASVRLELERQTSLLRNLGAQPAATWFLRELVPRMSRLGPVSAALGTQLPAVAGDPLDMEAAVAGLPPPPLPMLPSLVVRDRCWRLVPVGSAEDRLRIEYGPQTLACNGEFTPLPKLRSDGDAALKTGVQAAAASLVAARGTGPALDADVAEAVAELNRQGWIGRGDLMLIAGTPPLVAHLIPPHYSISLSRFVSRDLAMAAPLSAIPPPVLTRPIVLECLNGRWSPAGLPNGICLGETPNDFSHLSPEVRAAAFLRWAAVKVFQNERFHSSDGASSSSDYE